MVKVTEEVKKNRAKWIRALCSGRYKQTQSNLRWIDMSGEKYCCLGVACQISGLGKWDERDSFIVNDESSEFCLNDLPSVRGWLGMTEIQNSEAITMNDHDGFSFKYIAERFKEIWRMK